MDKQSIYMALLMLHENNFRGLHWKLHGPSFNTDHERFGGYYDQLGKFMDETAEVMITQGLVPIGQSTITDILNSDDVDTSYIDMSKDYNAEAANHAAKLMFNELYGLASTLATDDSLPVDVQDVYMAHAKYYRMEGNYKLGRTLLTTAVTEPPTSPFTDDGNVED